MADGPGTTGAVGGSAQGHVVSPFKEGSDEKVRGEGLSHGVGIEGGGTFEKGDKGHADGSLHLDYYMGVPITTNGKVTPTAGLGISSASREETTPGGETFKSGFKAFQVRLGALYQYHMPFFDRLFVAGGITGKIGPIWTAASDKVKLPTTCVPNDFGRGECEPSAGPREADSGTTSGTLMNYDRGSARETSGWMLGLQIPLRIGVDILRGSWGSMDLRGGPDLNVTKLLPNDGHGFSYVTWGLHGALVARFGGVDAYVPSKADQDGDGVPDSQDACPTEKGVPNADPALNGCPADEGKEAIPADPGAGVTPLTPGSGYNF